MAIIIGLQKQFYNWVTKTKLLWLQKHRERLGYKNKWVTKKITRLQKPGYKKSFHSPRAEPLTDQTYLPPFGYKSRFRTYGLRGGVGLGIMLDCLGYKNSFCS